MDKESIKSSLNNASNNLSSDKYRNSVQDKESMKSCLNNNSHRFSVDQTNNIVEFTYDIIDDFQSAKDNESIQESEIIENTEGDDEDLNEDILEFSD